MEMLREPSAIDRAKEGILFSGYAIAVRAKILKSKIQSSKFLLDFLVKALDLSC
jgi:hypothetical protein